MKFNIFSDDRFRFVLITAGILSLLVAGCVRDKYDFNKLSTQAHLSQSWILPVVHGAMKMENMVKPNDTIVFDDDGAVKLVYRRDSIFTEDVSGLVHLDDQDPDSVTFGLGPFEISDATVSGSFPNAAGRYDLDTLPRLHWLLALGGHMQVTVENNLSVAVTSLTLRVLNRSDNSVIGNDLTFTNISSGGTATLETDLTGERITQDLVLQIVSVSPSVALQNDAFTITLRTLDVVSGKGEAILPEQFLNGDTGVYKVDEDTLEITRLALSRGVFDLHVRSKFPDDIILEVVFPEAEKAGDTLRYSYLVAGGTLTDSLLLDGASFDLSTDVAQPYNAVPYRYLVKLGKSEKYVDFSGVNVFHLRYRLRDLTLAYAEGYFGEREFTFEGDTIDTGLEDVFSRIQGTLSLTNPKVRIIYSNGFGLPVGIRADVTGVAEDGREQALNAPPLELDHPQDRSDPPAEGTVEYNRDNTDIVELIDLRPVQIIYGGSARVNPGGFSGWNNFVTAQSSIVAGLEVEVPLEFRMQDLRLQDTLENPFQTDDQDTSDFSLRDLDYLDLYLGADNGFPIALSVKMYLYDSLAGVVADSILFGKILDAAPVDAGGRVTESVKTKQVVRIEGTQLEHLEEVNALIISVTFNTSGEGTKSVKIYTDYTLGFHLAAATALEQNFDLNE